MAFEKFFCGSKAEAIDDCGIWCLCTVMSKSNETVTVSFIGWNAEWDRNICDPSEHIIAGDQTQCSPHLIKSLPVFTADPVVLLQILIHLKVLS